MGAQSYMGAIMEKEYSKRILINKSNNQLRVARIEGSKLYDLEIEQIDSEQKIDNICNAEVVSIEPSLEAAFVNFGSKRNGFLPLKEIAPVYYPAHLKEKRGKISIKDILFEGQKILVQVIKEERGTKERGVTKGAALSTYITLAGRYLVLMPNNPKAGGISRRIEGEDREILKNILSALKMPSETSVIIRTAGTGKSLEELQWDLDSLLNLWQSIQQASKSYGAPYLIHQESDVAIRVIRDYLLPDIDEVLIDDQAIYEKVRTYIEKMQPAFLPKIKLYTQLVPLFSRFRIEQQIESVFQRKVRLPSGGEIIIDHTEALTSIDVNSAQATKGEYIEETALNTNLEAAQEIARQLRIRDLGGLFVVDFIDMEEEENNHKVEDYFRAALKHDRARTQLARISRFGLLEMSRQRLRPSLYETAQIICPRCHGQGTIRNIPSQASAIIHLIQENAAKEKNNYIYVQVPVSLATYLLNEKREDIKNIEKLHSISVIIIPNPYMEIPQYSIECTSNAKREKHPEAKALLSYDLLAIPTLTYKPEPIKLVKQKQEPVIKEVFPLTPAPFVKPKKHLITNWMKNLWESLTGKRKQIKKEEYPKSKKSYHRRFKSRIRYHHPKTSKPYQSKMKKFKRSKRFNTNVPKWQIPLSAPNSRVKVEAQLTQQAIVEPKVQPTLQTPPEGLIMVETRKKEANE
jgi:ribonuclease E